MRTARPSHASIRPLAATGSRRGTALVALGTVALVGGAPGAALAADEPADDTSASAVQATADDVVLPAETPVDQL
ncbi:hypothetical protein ICW40_18630, partial [Actinotalea ferrariae]|nr:hypothetical protein [Actinotalea ferrariae]